MSLGTILQTIITVIFIYLILSLLTSEMQEAIASYFEFRAKRLKESIKQLLGEDSENNSNYSLTKLLYENELILSVNQSSTSIISLIKKRKNRNSQGPSYLKPEFFSQSLLQVIQKTSGKKFINPEKSIHSVISVLEEIDDKFPAKSKLLEIANSLLLEKNSPNLSDFKNKLEEVFEEAQERSSGVYKRNAKGLSFVLGLFLAMIINADAFYIVSNLSKDNNSFGDKVVNELKNKELELFPDINQENTQSGLDDAKEGVIRNILDEVGTLPLGWNFDEELKNQNINDLIEILDKKENGKDCFAKDATNNDNAKCFIQFVSDIEQNPHLESNLRKDNDFIFSLNKVQKCLDSGKKGIDKCLQNKEYDFTNLQKYYDSSSSEENTTNQELINSLKPFEDCLNGDRQKIGECLQNKEYDFTNLKKYYDLSSSEKDTTNQELINSLKSFEDCLNGDEQKIGECLQGYDFPTTYRQYRLQIKNQQLTTRIENIQIQNNTLEQIISQVQRQGG